MNCISKCLHIFFIGMCFQKVQNRQTYVRNIELAGLWLKLMQLAAVHYCFSNAFVRLGTFVVRDKPTNFISDHMLEIGVTFEAYCSWEECSYAPGFSERPPLVATYHLCRWQSQKSA